MRDELIIDGEAVKDLENTNFITHFFTKGEVSTQGESKQRWNVFRALECTAV